MKNKIYCELCGFNDYIVSKGLTNHDSGYVYKIICKLALSVSVFNLEGSFTLDNLSDLLKIESRSVDRVLNRIQDRGVFEIIQSKIYHDDTRHIFITAECMKYFKVDAL